MTLHSNIRHRLFVGVLLLLLAGGAWLYDRRTETLAHEQLTTGCRLLGLQIVDQILTTRCSPSTKGGIQAAEKDQTDRLLSDFRSEWEKRWPEALQGYNYTVMKLPGAGREQALDERNSQKLLEFRADPSKQDETQLLAREGRLLYFGAVRTRNSCLGCHRKLDPKLEEDDILAVLRIEVPTSPIEADAHNSRAALVSTALILSILIVGGGYLARPKDT